MVRTVSLLIAAWVMTLTGCESASARFQERLAPPQPQVRSFAGDEATVFAAAKAAMKMIDFKISRAATAQGIIAAYSGIRSGESFGDTRQFTLDVRVRSYGDNQTDVSVILRQQDETSAFAGATNIPLRQHGLYDAYFAAVAEALKAGPGAK